MNIMAEFEFFVNLSFKNYNFQERAKKTMLSNFWYNFFKKLNSNLELVSALEFNDDCYNNYSFFLKNGGGKVYLKAESGDLVKSSLNYFSSERQHPEQLYQEISFIENIFLKTIEEVNSKIANFENITLDLFRRDSSLDFSRFTENYHVSEKLYNVLVNEDLKIVQKIWIPFLIIRNLICGNGWYEHSEEKFKFTKFLENVGHYKKKCEICFPISSNEDGIIGMDKESFAEIGYKRIKIINGDFNRNKEAFIFRIKTTFDLLSCLEVFNDRDDCVDDILEKYEFDKNFNFSSIQKTNNWDRKTFDLALKSLTEIYGFIENFSEKPLFNWESFLNENHDKFDLLKNYKIFSELEKSFTELKKPGYEGEFCETEDVGKLYLSKVFKVTNTEEEQTFPEVDNDCSKWRKDIFPNSQIKKMYWFAYEAENSNLHFRKDLDKQLVYRTSLLYYFKNNDHKKFIKVFRKVSHQKLKLELLHSYSLKKINGFLIRKHLSLIKSQYLNHKINHVIDYFFIFSEKYFNFMGPINYYNSINFYKKKYMTKSMIK